MGVMSKRTLIAHLMRQAPSHCRTMSSSTRTYDEALQKLSLLQSNRTTTHLFETTSAKKDINASAIPEMLSWLSRAGYTPSDLSRMRHIHVAGTKGKGSVCAHATAMLKACGRRVGTYTSPHLVSPRERIAIDGEPVAREVFARGFWDVWDRFGDAARREGVSAAEAEGPSTKPFYFRFLTILAWHIFLQQGIKDVVLECGIGGEYDSTNVVPAEAVSAAVVTQLGIDHVAMLGDTVEKIAWHKAGIFKLGVKAFTRGVEDRPAVMEVLRQRAVEKGAELIEVEDTAVEAWGGVEGSLRGDFQKYNQALAVMAVREHLGLTVTQGSTFRELPEGMVQGLKGAKLRGRGEMIQYGGNTWYLDGAHTKDSLGKVAKWFAKELGADEAAMLVFNQQDRDIGPLLTDFIKAVEASSGRSSIFSHAYFTTNEVAESDSAETEKVGTSVQEKGAATMRELSPSCESKVYNNIEDAVAEATKLGTGRKILVTGSMHLVGGVLQALEPSSLL